MPISPEDAGAEIQRFLTGLNASKHSAREKALKAFKAFVEKQGMEFYDDDVDSLLLGDGYTMGLMQWCGESSTGTQGALKRWVVVRLDVDFLQQLDFAPTLETLPVIVIIQTISPLPCPHRCRTAATAISLLKWLVSLRDSSGDENIFLARFLQVRVICNINISSRNLSVCVRALETCVQ